MKIVTTPHELMELRLWERYCDLHDTNMWAVNEGLLGPDDEITLTAEEAKELGLTVKGE